MKFKLAIRVFALWIAVFAGIFAQGQPKSAQAAPDVSGEWQGKLTTLRLNLTVDKAADGALSGKMLSPDQGNVTFAIDAVTFQNQSNTLHLDMKSIGAVYEGKLDQDGTEINGTWQQSGNSLPLIFRRPGAAAKTTLKPTTIGKIPFTPCRSVDGNSEGLCSTFEVFENRETKAGRKIPLNIFILPALTEKPGAPVFALAGGPGQSAVEAFPVTGYINELRQQGSVVMVDQRGTGKSNLLQCQLRDPNSAQAMISDFYSMDALRACRTEMEKRADLTQYTTSISMDDIDDVRAAMGYDKINLVGGSYGTKAALVYLHLHPEHVRTVTLEAVASPQYKIPLAFSKTIQASVDHLIAACAADAACHKDYPNLKQEFLTVLERLDKSPAQFELMNPAVGKKQTVMLSRGSFVAFLRPVLYVPQLASAFPLMVHSAYQNDWTVYGSSVFRLVKALDNVVARGMSFSVICAEDIPSMTEEEIKRDTAGTYLGDYSVRLYQKACKEWPRGSVPKNFFEPFRSDVPVLLISGVLDPATPPEMARDVASRLSHGRLVEIPEGTHGTGSTCIDGLISKFVTQGSADGLDTSCVSQIHLPPFITQEQINAARSQSK